ncbi:glycoside hydrolase family 30 protein [Paenibacillus xylaniclasticus]|uniref:glycoside hydrolase family 30 protein n=1 Tax=Paenibacillus xylaniclasticus TaxID=588083 RepID=UPI000FDC3C70|nr:MULTISPECIES: glycoside hydrolase family 30 protein [Paenibacillus]GFN31605.1 glycosyl hydrolase [Paenibacillus curdlanolyticus]
MNSRTIRIIQTSQGTEDRLTEKASIELHDDVRGIENQIINVYDDIEFQTIIGFGGAITEASAVTASKLSVNNSSRILKAYFDAENGIGYTICRSHINSCDFALGNYTYVQDGDDTLETFDISHDRECLLPYIKQAKALVGDSFIFYASPWSPPAWMKTNGEMNHGGQLKPEYRSAWARYYIKYIEAYEAEGVPVWGLTIQNEAKAVQIWDSCIYTAEEEKDFVRDYLGPELHKAGREYVKVMIWDHNKERVYDRARTAFDDAEASKYIWGIGFHWYSGDHFEALQAVQKRYPDKALMFTEGCHEGGVQLGAWKSGERYAHDIIGNLNHGMSGWTDWNIVLDEQGGPNHVGNYCDAPIIADTRDDSLTFQSSYYYIGHFSKYIRPGAVRIGCTKYTENLSTTAFRNLNGEIVVVVLNRTDEDQPYVIRNNDQVAEGAIPAHSIQTLLFPSI